MNRFHLALVASLILVVAPSAHAESSRAPIVLGFRGSGTIEAAKRRCDSLGRAWTKVADSREPTFHCVEMRTRPQSWHDRNPIVIAVYEFVGEPGKVASVAAFWQSRHPLSVWTPRLSRLCLLVTRQVAPHAEHFECSQEHWAAALYSRDDGMTVLQYGVGLVL